MTAAIRLRRGAGARALVWLLLAAVVLAAPAGRAAEAATRVDLYFFWSENCPHCRDAHPFVSAIPQQRPWVVVHALEVSRDRDSARRFAAMAEAVGQRAEAVPSFIYCGVMETGWDELAGVGVRLLRRLDACRAAGGTLAGPPAEALPAIPLLGAIDPATASLPLITVVLAGLDAFNPCAFFVLLFLLSLLAHQQDRRRMLVVGGVFVFASGTMYFIFMAAWLSLFELLGALRWVTAAAGALAILVGVLNVKDFFAFGSGPSLAIPDSAKPGIYRRARAILQAEKPAAMLAATLLLAVAANFYELLCTAGFPMVFTRVLTLAVPSAGARYGWLLLYNVIYVVPLALIVLAFVGTLSARRLSEREGRLLKLMSGTMMLELGLVLAFFPAWLDRLAVAVALLVVALAVTAVAARQGGDRRGAG